MNYFLRIAILTSFYFLRAGTAFASHAVGGELSYVWLHDSTYRVSFRFYRECAGTTAPPDIQLCYINSCASPVVRNTATLTPVPNSPGFTNGSEPADLCPGAVSACVDPQSAVFGYQSWLYSGDIVLSGHCDQWTLSTRIASRNNTTNVMPATGTLNGVYYEALLNNLTAGHNSSPVFTRLPPRANGLYNNVHYDPWLVDPDGDSLVAELVTLRNHSSFACLATSTTGPADYYPGYSPTQPITATGFTFNPATGAVSFLPTLPGTYALAVRVSDYRNGVRMGEVTREYQHTILTYSSAAVQLAIDPGSLPASALSNGTVIGHAGYPLGFCFNAWSSSATSVLVASDGHATAIPGGNLVYTGQLTDSVRGCFGWTPALTDTGLHYLPLLVVDSTCNGTSLLYSQSYSIPVRILSTPPPTAVTGGAAANVIRVFPNPTGGLIHITAPGRTDLQLHNPEGRLVKAAAAASELNLAGLPAGVYYLTVTDATIGAVLGREKVFRR